MATYLRNFPGVRAPLDRLARHDIAVNENVAIKESLLKSYFSIKSLKTYDAVFDSIAQGFPYRMGGWKENTPYWDGEDYFVTDVLEWCQETNTEVPILMIQWDENMRNAEFVAMFKHLNAATMFKLRWSEGL